MSKGDLVEVTGVIIGPMGGGRYQVKLDDSDTMIHAKLSGKMKLHKVRVLAGDPVRVATSPYDTSHGMIVYRGK